MAVLPRRVSHPECGFIGFTGGIKPIWPVNTLPDAFTVCILIATSIKQLQVPPTQTRLWCLEGVACLKERDFYGSFSRNGM